MGKFELEDPLKNRIVSSAIIAFVLALTVVVLLPATPWLYRTPDTDSSIFLLIGQKIRLGQFPYLNWYDHKPPLIFYINALGLTLGNGSRWGVWALEFVSLSAFSILGFLFLRRYFGKYIAAAAIGLTLLHFSFVYERGNLTEEYALPFQFAAIFLLSGIEQSGKSAWRFLGIGCMLAMASSLKQPLAGIGVAIFAYLAITYLLRNDWRGLLMAGVWLGLGFGAVWLVWFAYFAFSGVFADFWEAAFQYNVALSGIPLGTRMSALWASLDKWGGNSGFFLGGMATWLTLLPFMLDKDDRLLRFFSNRWLGGGLAGAGLVILIKGLFSFSVPGLSFAIVLIAIGLILLAGGGLILFGKVERWINPILLARQPEDRSTLFLPLLVALVDLPVAFLLSSLSGNNYSHYFMALLPSLAILMAFAIFMVRAGISAQNNRFMTWTWATILILAVATPGIQKTSDELNPRNDRQIEEIIAYVKQYTVPGDYVFQWGVAPQINLMTGRDSPTRFFFTDPLFVAGYSGKAQSQLLLHDLQANPPVFIINTEIIRLPLLTLDDPGQCGKLKTPAYYHAVLDPLFGDKSRVPQMPEGMGDVYFWICQHYARTASLGELNWEVFRWKGR